MRTAIFVYESSEVSIDTSEVGLALVGMNGPTWALDGHAPLTLPRGVYRVLSKEPIKVSIDGKVRTGVEFVAGELKDQVPKPRPQIILETDAASPRYEEFKRAFEDFFPVVPPVND
jgi:hypothetical protein